MTRIIIFFTLYETATSQMCTLSLHDALPIFVQGDDRIAKVFPQNYQSPGQNAANTDLKVSQGMANFYEYDHLGNTRIVRSEEHTSELQSRENLVCRLLLEKKKIIKHDRSRKV